MKIGAKTSIVEKSLYIMSVFLIAVLIISTIYKLLSYMAGTAENEPLWDVIIITIQILIMVGNEVFNREINSSHFGKDLKATRINTLKQKVYSTVEYSRQELRQGLNILFVITALIIILMMIISEHVYISVGAGILATIAYIYADYIPHAKFYAERYDRIFSGDIPNATRGLARIYYTEYKKTKFDEKNDDYSRINSAKEMKLGEINREYAYCYVWSHLADKKDMSLIIFFALFAVNIFTMKPSFYTDLIKPLGLREDIFYVTSIVISLAASIVFALLVFYQLPNYNREQEEILEDVLSVETDDESLLNRYNNLLTEKRSAMIHARARFDYTMLQIEKGNVLTEDDLNYQMLFIHKRVVNLQRYNNTVILTTIAVVLFIMDIIGPNLFMAIPVVVGGTLLALGKLIIKDLGKKRIAEECERLGDELHL